MTDTPSVSTGTHHVQLEGDLKGFEASLSPRTLGAGLDVVTLTLTADQAAPPPEVTIVFSHPLVDIQARWVPATRSMPGLLPEWDCGLTTKMTRDAPVVCFYNLLERNRLTFACSEAVSPVIIRGGVHEESASLRCSVKLFTQPHPPTRRYDVRMLIDTRDVPFHESLEHVVGWWETDGGLAPLSVPDCARAPFYSTWYSFHQLLDVDRVLEECRLARELGCEAIIIDDGWQTMNKGRGYAYTGDWEAVRIGDMKAFVDAVHDTGLKFLLWYAFAFAGECSRAIKRFQGKTITYVQGANTAVLDPRYPEVRAYLLDVYTTAMREWGLDGFKLDFVDWLDPCRATETSDGMDLPLLTDAIDRLMTDLLAELRTVRPDVMVEFRQPYIGPAMRRYANMFRAVDCPNDSHTNRINTLDLRLLSGRTAVHSDMFMWNPADPPECAALQLLNVLFAVPQVSVMIQDLPAEYRAMLAFWLGFWRENRDVLLDGQFTPQGPASWYPVVVSSTPHKRVVAIYSDAIARVGPEVPPELLIVNATRGNRIVIELTTDAGKRNITVSDCQGRQITQQARSLSAGVHTIPVPPGGLARVTF